MTKLIHRCYDFKESSCYMSIVNRFITYQFLQLVTTNIWWNVNVKYSKIFSTPYVYPIRVCSIVKQYPTNIVNCNLFFLDLFIHSLSNNILLCDWNKIGNTLKKSVKMFIQNSYWLKFVHTIYVTYLHICE